MFGNLPEESRWVVINDEKRKGIEDIDFLRYPEFFHFIIEYCNPVDMLKFFWGLPLLSVLQYFPGFIQIMYSDTDESPVIILR